MSSSCPKTLPLRRPCLHLQKRARPRGSDPSAHAGGHGGAKVRGKPKGRKPKLSAVQERHMVALHRAGDHSVAELVELFGVDRATVYRALDRHPVEASAAVTLPRVEA